MKCDHLDHSGLLLLFITCGIFFPLDQCDFNIIIAVGPEVKETLQCCWTIKCVALSSKKNHCENTRVKICVMFYAFLLYKHMVLWIVHRILLLLLSWCLMSSDVIWHIRDIRILYMLIWFCFRTGQGRQVWRQEYKFVPVLHIILLHRVWGWWQGWLYLLGDSGGVVNSLDFCPASLKSLGCFYFQCVLSSQWKAVTVNLQILHCQR